MTVVRVRAIVVHELKILRQDPTFLIIFTLMPLLIMAFLKPTFRAALILVGNPGANGAEQAVPGMAVLFALLLVGNVGYAVFREHGWNTWPRLVASPANGVEIMIGKSVTPLLALCAQLTVLFVVGGVLFDLRVQGSIVGLVLVAASLAVTLVCMGLLLISVCRTVLQLQAGTYLGAMVLAGVGGALTPISSLPGWARHVAPAAPTYWAMRGFRSAILVPGSWTVVLWPVLVLLGFATFFALVAASRFRVGDVKIGWA
ncbi:MAG TPA: ABC transporter permease [Acidimicrobiales bacterium]|jgi:ABC-2 type transport system permease protein|nr:ABC transporter permease [Acidimicrobiales bacterium]